MMPCYDYCVTIVLIVVVIVVLNTDYTFGNNATTETGRQ